MGQRQCYDSVFFNKGLEPLFSPHKGVNSVLLIQARRLKPIEDASCLHLKGVNQRIMAFILENI